MESFRYWLGSAVESNAPATTLVGRTKVFTAFTGKREVSEAQTGAGTVARMGLEGRRGRASVLLGALGVSSNAFEEGDQGSHAPRLPSRCGALLHSSYRLITLLGQVFDPGGGFLIKSCR